MRRIVHVYLSFMLILLASVGTGYAQDEAALVGFWRFDEGKGKVAGDSSAKWIAWGNPRRSRLGGWQDALRSTVRW